MSSQRPPSSTMASTLWYIYIYMFLPSKTHYFNILHQFRSHSSLEMIFIFLFFSAEIRSRSWELNSGWEDLCFDTNDLAFTIRTHYRWTKVRTIPINLLKILYVLSSPDLIDRYIYGFDRQFSGRAPADPPEQRQPYRCRRDLVSVRQP